MIAELRLYKNRKKKEEKKKEVRMKVFFSFNKLSIRIMIHEYSETTMVKLEGGLYTKKIQGKW